MLDLQCLNDHSRQFAARLFRRWPEWHRHARFDPYEEFEKEALLVEVPRPRDGSGHGLFITTSEWEISVGFGADFHTRFGANGDADETSFYDEALDFLAGFVAERIVLATASEDGEWLGSWRIDLAHESLADVTPGPGELVKIRSWLGTYDRDLRG
jgi:hypothetical protein